MAVGEYANGYGFLLPNPVSHTLGMSPATAWDRVVYVNLKNEETWFRMLGDF